VSRAVSTVDETKGRPEGISKNYKLVNGNEWRPVAQRCDSVGGAIKNQSSTRLSKKSEWESKGFAML